MNKLFKGTMIKLANTVERHRHAAAALANSETIALILILGYFYMQALNH